MQGRSDMATRRFAVLFTILGFAVFVSMAGFALLYFAFGRAPSVPSDATLVLRVGGDLAEMAPADVVGYLRGVRTPTVRSVVDSLRKAKVDSRIRAVLIKPTGFTSPYWGKVQEVRDAMLDFKKSGKPLVRLSRVRRRSRVLPRHGGRQGVPDAVDVARSDWRRHIRAVPERHARQDRRGVRICIASATTRRP